MTIKGVAHVAVNATNIERSIRFYHEKLGFPIIEDLTLETGFRLVHVQISPGSTIELFGRVEPVKLMPEGQYAGIVHLALTVDDVDKMYAELQARGVEFTSAPRVGRGQTKKLVFFKDPDGVLIEVCEK
jgi:catechol 2,3-dioxygenase-like lactoylglutathione lyase family enzyme